MKKQLLTSLLATAFVGTVSAQLPVSTSPQNRKAVLQEFTGIHCGYCPDGHYRADLLKNANPGNVLLINIHSGSFANAAVGEPDFTTTEGTAIDGMPGMNILGYPAGDINRTNFGTPAYAQQTVSPYGMAQSRGTWSATATNSILNQASFANVALQGDVNVVTRVLTVTVQVYYTANSPVTSNSLTVMLMENKIAGPQSNYGNYNPGNYNPDGSYNHNHVLRKTLTPTFGLTIPVTTMGTTFSTTLTYTIPATYGASGKTTACMLGNLELGAFVTQSNSLTVTGANGPIALTGFANTTDIGLNNFTADAAVCSGNNFGAAFKFANNGSATVTSAVFSYTMNGGTPNTFTYTGNVNPMTISPSVTLNIPTFTAQANNTLNISVVSVNGATDQVAVDNTVTTNAPLTTIVANNNVVTMNFNQDRYGSESSWSVVEELTNAAVVGGSGGPYADLGANGTQMHTHTFVINPNTCYKLKVNDAYGDGINAGFGAGGYTVVSGGNIITSNGAYGKGETKLYKSALFTGIASTDVANIGAVNVFPNPASGSTNLSITLTQNETVNITVINALGQEIYSSKNNNFNAGDNNLNINTENWSSGTYFINVSTVNGSVKHKLNVIK